LLKLLRTKKLFSLNKKAALYIVKGSFFPFLVLSGKITAQKTMNHSSLTYDFIITGFGCSGMSLMYYLLNSKLKECRILIIDCSDKSENDRTWCYWAESPLEIHPTNKPIISWDKISISNGKNRIKKPLGHLKYFHINSSDFYFHIKDFVKGFSNVHFIQDSVISWEESETEGVKVITSNNGAFFSKMVFNSIPDRSISVTGKNVLKQIFVGWKIKTKENCFDPETAVMMDFVQESDEKTDFFYILPFNEKEALLEYTVFCTGDFNQPIMENAIRQFIREKLDQEEFEITFREKGSIPMTNFPMSLPGTKNIIPLGILAGCSKPSTGFTFHNIQKHCQAIVKKLEVSSNTDKLVWSRNGRFHFYDNILLNIAKKWPKKLPQVFYNLFENNSGPEILHFLSEETSFLDEIKLLSRLKFSIYMKSLIHYEKH
jgi:lycopene beta-cyclase